MTENRELAVTTCEYKREQKRNLEAMRRELMKQIRALELMIKECENEQRERQGVRKDGL